MFDTVLVQIGLICDNVSWLIGLVSDGVDDVDIGLGNIMEGTGSNNQVLPSHGSLIVSFVIIVDGGGIP